MISPKYIETMAAYGRWQNASHLQAMRSLPEAELSKDRGAFFSSILGTANHLLWADRIWLSRFAGMPAPNANGISGSVDETPDLATFASERVKTDDAIRGWAEAITPAEIEPPLRWYSGALGREVERPRAILIVHFFNHQTHHRGQIHAMLTAAGAKLEDTDLFAMPNAAE